MNGHKHVSCTSEGIIELEEPLILKFWEDREVGRRSLSKQEKSQGKQHGNDFISGIYIIDT